MAGGTSKPCFHFARGHCKFGDKCKFSHELTASNTAVTLKEPCPYLETPRGCFKGEHCRYSHDLKQNANNSIQSLQHPGRSRPRNEHETGFREWTFLIPRQNARSPVLELGKFFRLGWDLLSRDPTDTGQQIIKKLATEEGLIMIKALTDRQDEGAKLQNRLTDFTDSTLPFLRTLSHPDILSSLILENPLDTICTFLFGPNGRRATRLFQSVASALASLARGDIPDNLELTLTDVSVSSTLTLLERIVELNQGAQIIDEFTSVVDQISTTVPEHFLHGASRSLTRLRNRLGLGAAIPLPKDRPKQQNTTQPVFNIFQEPPGTLSTLGPRHDNDHANISEIKILPTTEEVLSSRIEYLPTNDPTTHHLPGLAGLLDRQFRLLREDTVGQLRDAVHIEFQRLNKPADTPSTPKRQGSGTRTIVYKNVTLLRVDFDRKHGLQVIAEFDQPPRLKNKGAKEREEWWKNTKQLQIDAFVCLVSSTGHVIFFSVSDPVITPPSKDKNGDERTDQLARYQKAFDHERPNLYKDAQRAALMLVLVEENVEDITWINGHLGKSGKLRQSLVEFPGILLPSFQPTLQALQRMSRTLDLPFSQLIAPNVSTAANATNTAPAYSRRPGFAFNMKSLTGGESLRLTPGQPFDDTLLQEKSTLDDAQRISIVNSLSSGIALIQGPPGTGKSFTGVAIIKTLLENRDVAGIGPVVCVCYTNHALDQLLEHLVRDGVDQLIRLGSRSKSELLQNVTLHSVSSKLRHTKEESHEKYELYESLDVILDEIAELMPGLRNPAHWTNIKEYLESNQETHFQQLFGYGVDEDGFREVKGKKFNVLNSWIKGAPHRITSTRPIPELLLVNLQAMSGTERSALHKYWIEQSVVVLNRRLLHLLESYKHVKESLQKRHQELHLRCLRSAHVVGVTTTGLARNLDILRRIHAKVVVMEEAGEVLEAHTLTALLPSVEHAILIGDHEQLRPQINNYEFQSDNPRGAGFSLDISLFERLIHPQPGHLKLPYSSLEVQRRMHPSIAQLIRSTLYPKLQDHLSVTAYPEVEGMRRRLFWLDHNNKEDAARSDQEHSFSKTNSWEVEMVAALVSHLVRQGVYRSEDIAVLTPYLGQLQRLKQRLRSSFAILVGDRDLQDLEAKGLEEDADTNTAKRPTEPTGSVRKTTLLSALRLATVDNFQGEEAKIIIVSLVRCNDSRKCGFLKTSNRINVLLSRARHGMYIFGSAFTARVVPMWAQVVEILENDGNLGPTLALCCPRHPNTPIEVSKPDDFSMWSPEGGCNQKGVITHAPNTVATLAT
ncbi:MAG: hypothetical protein Q9219_004259 [cf. Caloplaca sp. 3 TL-2023]